MKLEIKNQENNYLYQHIENYYVAGLMQSLAHLEPYLSKRQKKSLLLDLQVDGTTFDEAKYLQAACETSIAAYLANKYGSNFVYEPKVNPPKDVDCGFQLNGKTFNIEVKCPDYSKKNEIDKSDSFKFGAFGRLDDFDDIFDELKALLDPKTNPAVEAGKTLVKQQHMDNKLKDYLVSAHGKFAELTGSDELNVLAVGCDDWTDMQKWFYYMFGPKGLFTKDAYYPFEEYENVDVVMLTNLYHRHHNYENKDKIENHWDFSQSFNLIFSNPQRKKDKKEAVLEFVETIPNHSKQLDSYRVSRGLSEMRISHYVCEELLEKGLYYFQPKI